MTQILRNILLVSGSGRNVGKTTFICEVISHCKISAPIAIKITPHFHPATLGLVSLKVDDNFRIYEETNTGSEKDSSLFLAAGASRVFYIQAKDQHLKEAFETVIKELRLNQPVIVESAALRHTVVPGLFLVIRKKDEDIKPSAKNLIHLADQLIISDAYSFSIQPKAVTFNQTWKINKI